MNSTRQKVSVSRVRESTRLQGAQRREQLIHPPPPAVSGYLEPPDDFFPPTNTTGIQRQLGHTRAASLTPLVRQHSNGPPRASAAGPVPNTRPFARTQSMDPPNRYRPSFAAASKPIPLTRDVSMDDGSFSNEMSVSPTHQPFRMRTSLTPAPSGQAFGPDPARLGRNESEPPPLAQLGDKPVFVKAPSEAPISRNVARQAPITLGELAEAQRTGKGIQRSRSSLKIGSDTSMQDLTETSVPAPTRPVTQTEKMIRELEIYKTPLLPTRLRGSSVLPEMFQPKKSHAPVLMHDRETRPRLGTADKHGSSDKAPDEGRSAKPYAGRGGMKKLLERRRLEEDKEKEKEKFD
ncbi:hypothetical protein PHLGIDRAFT_250471 [Phlebiopsis gigantea 11061_1 CR5-6]|uniref:Pal1-domain-containing protein n=1 Tax=Phlebiopsis gigantea (strain 11061_1 CR5-6) TaxID=745531 RepID=A0A0C3PSI5_PHLG1|nr:hypothetical protein PHLGIDRAFT_250471 [Phlebiopsis gigantea 11061_1 CR5-6]